MRGVVYRPVSHGPPRNNRIVLSVFRRNFSERNSVANPNPDPGGQKHMDSVDPDPDSDPQHCGKPYSGGFLLYSLFTFVPITETELHNTSFTFVHPGSN